MLSNVLTKFGFVVCSILATSVFAQTDESDSSAVPKSQTATASDSVDFYKMVDEVVLELNSGDLERSILAYDLLAVFANSSGYEIRKAARNHLQKFHVDAWTWLQENGKMSPKSRMPKQTIWDARWESKDLPYIAFVDREVDLSKLVYLKAFNFESIAFVDLPDFTDKHLDCVAGQEKLVSLTVENTGVQGIGFSGMYSDSVEVIFLTDSPVTNTTLFYISDNFPKLSQVSLQGTQVSKSNASDFQNTLKVKQRNRQAKTRSRRRGR